MVFAQKQRGGGWMFNVIKTRAAVSILEWLTSFFAHSSGGLLGGRPAAGVEFHMLSLKQSYGNFSRVRGVSLARNWKTSADTELRFSLLFFYPLSQEQMGSIREV